MQSALHITTKVLPGNRIKIQLPPLAEGKGAEGKDVDVFVVLPSTTTISTHYNDQTLTQVVETSTVPAAQAIAQSAEALSRIRSRPRVNPIDAGLPDSTALIREDRDR